MCYIGESNSIQLCDKSLANSQMLSVDCWYFKGDLHTVHLDVGSICILANAKQCKNVIQQEKTSQTVQKHFYQHLKIRKVITRNRLNRFSWNFVTLLANARANFLCTQKKIKSSSEDGGNYVNKNWCAQKI